MATITSLTALALASVSSNDYLLVANSSVPTNYKFLLSNLFPVLSTAGTGSESLFVSITNKNTLNFKGIKSLSNIVSVATATNNIVLDVVPGNIDLDLCDNSTAGFLSTVDLTGTDVTGSLPVSKGGTGAASFTANSILLGNGTGAFASSGAPTNGQILIGRTGLAPVLANLTAGTNVTITNGSGTIEIAASLTTLTAKLDAAGYVIHGIGWINNAGGAGIGLAFNGSDQAFIGTTTNDFYQGDLNVGHNLYLDGSESQELGMTSASLPRPLRFLGADASAAAAGGQISMSGGASIGVNAGGSVNLYAGAHDGTGTGGDIGLYWVNSAVSSQLSLMVKGTTGYIGIGGENSPDSPLHIKQTDASGNVPVLTIEQLDTGESLINFVGTSGAASANSISSSTATAGTKTGAIQVKINGTVHWLRLYSSAE